jgi:AraC family transcriptional regulator
VIEQRTEERLGFSVVGVKTWIGGTEDTNSFGRFWDECRKDGTLQELSSLRGEGPGSHTNAMFLGLSAVDNDPSNREFHFYVAVEPERELADSRFEEYAVPASTWAIFRTEGVMPDALIEAEIHAFRDWLPASGYVHAYAPELEVYPPSQNDHGVQVEFWLPIEPMK